MTNDNYPPGAANDPLAPYNQVDPEPIEIEVTVSITLSKTVKIYVDDYIQEAPESDGEVYYAGDIDFSECNLNKAVEEQITLPNEKVEGWNIDDFEVILE
jgi:hypothetical protein